MPQEFDAQIGANIRARRKALKLPAEKLATLANVDIGTVSRTENGITQITLDTAIRLCRALSMSLTDLVGRSEQEGNEEQVGEPLIQGKSSDIEILRTDANAVVDVYRISKDACILLIVEWLNNIADVLFKEKRQPPFSLDAQDVQLYLSKHEAFRFRIKYPEDLRIWVVEAIYRLGGELGYGDISLLLSAIADDSERYQRLEKASKDTIWRLQTAKAERVRLSEVVKLEKELSIDLIGMLNNAEKLLANSKASQERRWCQQPEEARLVSLFVSICAWLRYLDTDSTHWLKTIRKGIESKSATIART